MGLLDLFKQDIDEDEKGQIDMARARPMATPEPAAEPTPVAPQPQPQPIASPQPVPPSAPESEYETIRKENQDRKRKVGYADAFASLFGGDIGAAHIKGDMDKSLANFRTGQLDTYNQGRQKVEDDYKARGRDPADASAKALRTLVARQHLPQMEDPAEKKQFVEALEGMGSEQLKSLLGGAGKQESGRDWTLVTEAGPDGKVLTKRVNKITGAEHYISGHRGYAPKHIKDPVTGDYVWAIPGSPQDPTIKITNPTSEESGVKRPGETTADYNRRRMVETDTAKRQGAIDVKEDEDIRDAEARREVRKSLHSQMLSLYDEASTDPKAYTGTGPISGRASKMLNKVGISVGEGADKLMTKTGIALAAYIKDMSGTAASQQEMERLSALMPGISDSRDLFQNKMQAALEEAEKIVQEKILKAGAPADTGGMVPSRRPQAKTIKQNGVTYTLNEETGEYE